MRNPLLFSLVFALAVASSGDVPQKASEAESGSALIGKGQPMSNYVLSFDGNASFSPNDTINIIDGGGNVVNAIFFDADCGCLVLRNEVVQVRAYNPDYGVLAFDCDSVDGRWAYIKMDGKRYMMAIHPTMKVETWNDHLQNAIIGVGKDTPLHESPDGKVINCSAEDLEPGFNAIEMRGEWLLVETDTVCGDFDCQYQRGWLKWRTADTLLIKLYYSC